MSSFDDLSEIRRDLVSAGSIKEQSDIIKSKFPNRFEMYDEDGKLIIKDIKTGEEVEGPDYLSLNESIAGERPTIEGMADAAKYGWDSSKELVKQETLPIALGLIGANLATPAAGPWSYPLLVGLGGATGAGVGRVGTNALRDKPLQEGVAEAAIGGAVAPLAGKGLSAASKMVGTAAEEAFPPLAKAAKVASENISKIGTTSRRLPGKAAWLANAENPAYYKAPAEIGREVRGLAELLAEAIKPPQVRQAIAQTFVEKNAANVIPESLRVKKKEK
jgi:hypothetical protein